MERQTKEEEASWSLQNIGVPVLVRLGRSQVATVATRRPRAIAAGRSAKQLQIAGRLLSLRSYLHWVGGARGA